MGSGKTAVGKYLARLLDAPFYDSDAEIERRTGVDIPYIFEKEGEAGFRERERETIEALTVSEPMVLATGGGAVLLPENRACLAARGFVVYLRNLGGAAGVSGSSRAQPAAAQQRGPRGETRAAHARAGAALR